MIEGDGGSAGAPAKRLISTGTVAGRLDSAQHVFIITKEGDGLVFSRVFPVRAVHEDMVALRA